MPLHCKLRTVKDLPGVGVIDAHGGIDPLSLEALEIATGEAKGKGYRVVILDLGEIRYINSAGLSYLVNLSDALARRGGALLLANPQPKVRIVLDFMGVSQFLRIFKTLDAALLAVASARRRLRKQA